MTKIDIEYERLCKGIRKLAEAVIRFKAEVDKIAEYAENLDIFWDGDVNDAYRAKLGEDLVTIGLATSRILDTLRIIVDAYGIYIRAEEDVAHLLETERR